MDAADAAGGEHADPRERRADHRGGDGRRTGGAGRERKRQIGAAHLAHVVQIGERANGISFEPDADPAVDDCDRGRLGAVFAHDRLDRERRFDILRIRHAVRDDRRFERDDGAAAGDAAAIRGAMSSRPVSWVVMAGTIPLLTAELLLPRVRFGFAQQRHEDEFALTPRRSSRRRPRD